MKTLPHTLAFLCLLCATALTAKANSPPVSLADTITIQFNTGYGVDCNGSGRQCLSAQPMAIGELPSLTSDAVGKAWFDGQGRFVLEIRQVLKTALWNELEGGTFLLEANVPVPASIMSGLGRQGQLFTLAAGVHSVKKQPDSSYRIEF